MLGRSLWLPVCLRQGFNRIEVLGGVYTAMAFGSDRIMIALSLGLVG
jgi:hypothetical protein